METYTSSASSILSMVNSMQTLPPLDSASLSPIMSLDMNGLIKAVSTMWAAMQEQRELFVQMEKEMQRRKMEQEVKMRNLQNDLEGQVQAEAHKRQQDMDKMRLEVKQVKEEVRSTAEQIRKEAKELEENIKITVDTAMTTMRAQLTETNQRMARLSEDVNNVRDDARKAFVLASETDKKLDGVDARLSRDLARFRQVVGLSKEDIEVAVESGTEKETMLKTPALMHILSLIQSAESKAADAKKDAFAAKEGVAELETRVRNLEKEVGGLKTLPEKLVKLEKDTQALIRSEDEKLYQRILAMLAKMEGRSGAGVEEHHYHGGEDNSNDIAALRQEVADLRAIIEAMKNDFGNKFATKVSVKELRSDHEALAARVARLEAALSDLIQRLEGMRLGGTPSKPQKSSGDASAILSLKDMLDELTQRVVSLESHTRDLEIRKLDRDELTKAIQDVLLAMEQAINQLYDEMMRAMSGIKKDVVDATAGRFKCLSCNREAGPLVEKHRETLSKAQFPPSVTFMTRDLRDVSPPKARAHVPGAGKDPQNSSNMTSSRKKLQHYYEWLQNRPGSSGGGSGGRSGTSPMRRPNESTNIPVTTFNVRTAESPKRQAPEEEQATAVGADGRYYGNVTGRGGKSTPPPATRPRSAPMRRGSGDEGGTEGGAKPISPSPPRPVQQETV